MMDSKGFGSRTEELEASIQARIGEFLGLRKKLLTMMDSPLVTIKDPASELYSKQLQLESELSGVLDIIQKIKTSAYTLSDIARVSTFYYLMESQIRDVNKLEVEYISAGGIAVPPVDWSKYLLVGGAFLLGYAFLSRK